MRKIISVVLSFGLLFQQSGLLYAAGEINLANYLSQARNAIVQPDRFQPARLRYISYDIANNDFKLLLDKGNAKLNDATPELFNYFLIGLALPNDTFWVNLRPDAPDNIIDPILEKTDIGKIFLEADLQLKKDTAGLTSPQNPEGKAYWDKLYKKAGELFGTENITIPTITRPWIVPNEVIVRETEDSAYIYKATLKVMLESDYLIGRGGSRTAPTPDQYAFSDPRLKELNEYSTQLIRETIIPKLTKEINSSKRYAQLRQVYYSLVLSRWFKQKYSSPGSISAPERQSAGASANSYISLIDSGNLANLASKESYDKQTYFQAYQKSFKDGEYNLKETVATPFGQSIRSYVSGGLGLGPQIDEKISKLVNTVGKPVTRALEDGLAPVDQTAALSASPLTDKELYEYMDEIRVYLKGANKGISHLFANIDKRQKQDITDVLRIIMGPIDKKIVSITKGELSGDGLLSYVQSLRDGLNEIATKNLPLRLNNMANGGKKEMATKVSENIVAALVKVEELYKKSQNSVGSALTLEDYVNYVEQIRGKLASFYQWESKKSSDATLDDLIEAAKRAGESKLKPNAMELAPEAEEWYGVAGKLAEIKSEFSVYAASPVGKELGISDIYGRKLQYIAYWKLSQREKVNFSEAFKKLPQPSIENYFSAYLRYAVAVDSEGSIVSIVGWVNYDPDARSIKNIAVLQGINKKNQLREELRKKCEEELRTGEDFWKKKSVSGSPVVGKPLPGNDGKEIGMYVSLGDLGSVQKKELLDLVKGKVFPALTIKESEIQGIGEDGDAILSVLLEEGILKEIPSVEGFLKVNKSLYIGNIRNIIKNDKDFPEVWRILKYSISGAEAMPVVEMSHLNKMRFAVKVNEKGELILLGLMQFDNKIKKDVMGDSIEIISALSKARKKEVGVSSAVVSRQVPQKPEQWGGIDLTDRALQIKLERVGSFAATPLLLPQVKNAQGLDLDREFEQIEALASSGISPNSRRILELFTVCHYRGEFGQRLTQIISCLKASSAIQEAEAIDSDEDFRLALMMPEVFS